ncbi:MAG: ATP-dependent DNA helicase RecG [Arachnia sp.]
MARWRTGIHRELSRGLRDVLGSHTANSLAALGIHSVGDLVRHTPRRYLSGTEMSDFTTLRVGDEVAVVAQVVRSSIRHGRSTRVEAILTDGQAQLLATFFAPKQYHAEYWAQVLSPGSRGIFVGKVSEFMGNRQLAHPDFVIIDGHGAVTARKTKRNSERAAMQRAVQRATLVGLYPATSKLPTWTIAESIDLVLPGVTSLGDTLPEWVVAQAGVLDLPTALREVHQPVAVSDAEAGIHRLRFDEAFGLQLALAQRRSALADERARPRPSRPHGLVAAFDQRLPFELTDGQRQVSQVIAGELAQDRPMHRLLQGDVGSGKTLVALRAMLTVVDSGGQAALLAPTEVLAKQHYRTICSLLGDLAEGGMLGGHPEATSVALLVGGGPAAARRVADEAIASGEAGIVIGTHALLSDATTFADLGLVVVDEQHRFGVEQRAALVAKAAERPHTLVMTATPIPRSLAMTVFGDLSILELRERPQGRAEVKTVFVNTSTHPAWVDRAWQRIREEVAAGRQAFVVCPAITGKQTDADLESVADGLTAVADLLPELEAGPLAGLRLAMVHGKQPTTERDQAMTRFAAGEVDVLIATTVIEVGVDVPNASVMVIMDADRFGIAQLHQLRGRIGRGIHPGLCLLLARLEGDNPVAEQRLNALVASTDGFALAERDLELRREGDVLGAGQSGASSLKLLRVLADQELIARARDLAELVHADPRAADDPHLADLMAQAAEVAAGDWLAKS